MVQWNALVGDEQAGTAYQLLAFAIDPDVEQVLRAVVREFHVHVLDDVAALGGAVQQCAEKYLGCRKCLAAAVGSEEEHRRLRHLQCAALEQCLIGRPSGNAERQDGYDDADVYP